MKTLVRGVAVFGLAVGMAVVFAPGAGAAPPASSGVVQRSTFPTSFGTTNPCNGAFVQTTGTGTLVTVTTPSQHTTVLFRDREMGGGYGLVEGFVTHATSLSSTYAATGKGFWRNSDTTLDFHGTITYTAFVGANNAPAGVSVTGVSLVCGP